jgi:hypothetical protein
MAALVDNSVKASDNTGGGATTTLETASFAVAGSNRVLYVLAGSGAGTPVDPSAVKWGGSGGTSLTQIGTTLNVGANVKISLWRLIAPAATSSTIHVTWGSGQDERWIIGVSTKDTDQTTPNGTLASATGSGTGPTVAATTTSGNLVLDFMSWLDGGGSSFTVTDDVPDSLQEIEGATLQYEGAGASRETAAGASTTTSWTISGGAGNDWGIFAFQVNEGTAPAVSDPVKGYDDGVPMAWYSDPGYAALYGYQQQGIPLANRADVAEPTIVSAAADISSSATVTWAGASTAAAALDVDAVSSEIFDARATAAAALDVDAVAAPEFASEVGTIVSAAASISAEATLTAVGASTVIADAYVEAEAEAAFAAASEDTVDTGGTTKRRARRQQVDEDQEIQQLIQQLYPQAYAAFYPSASH